MKPAVLLFLLGSAVHAGPLTKAGKTGGGVAPQQEVDLLMFGIIQFSQAFKHAHESTEAKVKNIGQILRRQEEALRRLGAQAEQAADAEEETKAALRRIQAQMAEQQARTRMTKERLAGVEQEEAELRAKVKRLEMGVDSSAPGSVKELQARAEEHGSILGALRELVARQRESSNGQDDQLRKLQRKVKRTSAAANAV